MFAQIAAIAKDGQRSSKEDSRDQAKVVSYLGEDEAEEASDDDSARKRTSKKRCLSRSKKTMRSSAKKRRRAESDDAEDDAQQEEEEVRPRSQRHALPPPFLSLSLPCGADHAPCRHAPCRHAPLAPCRHARTHEHHHCSALHPFTILPRTLSTRTLGALHSPRLAALWRRPTLTRRLTSLCPPTPPHARSALQQAQSKPRKFKVGGTRSKPGGVSTQEKRKRFQAKRRKPIGVSRDDSVGAEDADGSDGDAPQPEVSVTTHTPRAATRTHARSRRSDTHTPLACRPRIILTRSTTHRPCRVR